MYSRTENVDDLAGGRLARFCDNGKLGHAVALRSEHFLTYILFDKHRGSGKYEE
jgi:hypothetical protein